jgi:hypothetical protein
MLRELAEQTAAGGWAIASMLFFLAIWLLVAVRVMRARADDMNAKARLALEGEDEPSPTPRGDAEN